MKSAQRQYYSLSRESISLEQLQFWASQFRQVTILDNHTNAGYSYPGTHSFDLLIGVGAIAEFHTTTDAFEQLQQFHDQQQDWLLGYLTYDLKNQLEQLSSQNHDEIQIPEIHFFQPQYLFLIREDEIQLGIATDETSDQLLEQIKSTELPDQSTEPLLDIQPRIKHADYIKAVLGLKHHIQVGDIYEVNFCQEFYAEHADITPWNVYQKLTRKSSTPFACYYRNDMHHLMCASPERYLQKKGSTLLSQPIKGTSKRGETPEEDQQLREALYQNTKERSENVMIVDLVRNDLSRTAQKGSVKVEELFGIYAFPQVHQMISTVTSELRENTPFTEVLKASFPMGSMTGAPKVKAMELIEQFESTKRGLYSGTVGYITPEGDFDFNVIIRSILYNASSQFLSFMVGGAITSKSDPEAEYQESLLKAKAIFEVLNKQK